MSVFDHLMRIIVQCGPALLNKASKRNRLLVEQFCMLLQTSVIDMDGEGNYCFALTGRTWAVIRRDHPNLTEKIAVRGTVFARMSPEQKGQLIEELQDLGECSQNSVERSRTNWHCL